MVAALDAFDQPLSLPSLASQLLKEDRIESEKPKFAITCDRRRLEVTPSRGEAPFIVVYCVGGVTAAFLA